MKIQVNQLYHPTKGRLRFLWKRKTGRVAILRYDLTGTYTGASTLAKTMARTAWKELIDEGWSADTNFLALSKDDMAFVEALS